MRKPISRQRAFALLLTLAALAVPSRARAQAVPAIAIPLGEGTELAMVLVPSGSFMQGSPEGEKGRGIDEPQRQVTISAPFYMGKFPVTRRQFALFVGQSGYATEAEKGSSGGSGWDGHALVQRKEFTWKSPGFAQSDADPVALVTYADAEAFAAWATTKARRKVQLPTEAQWEYAARAGTRTAYFGAADEEHALDLGWFKPNAGAGTRAVGRKMPNAWNLHEMGGDVYQWCRDWYAPYAPGPVTDPEVTTPPPGDTARRVLRGGSWLTPARAGRAAARHRDTPGGRSADNGFRLIADVDGPSLALTPPPRPPPAPAPLETPTPPPGAPQGDTEVNSSGTLAVALVAILGGLGVLVGLVAYAVRRGRSRSGIDPASVVTRVAPDGFWIAARAPAGTRVRYQAVVGGVPVDQMVTLDGSEQGTFVYTGSPPDQVRILGVTAAVGVAMLPSAASPRRSDASEPASLPEPPSGGSPPAD